MSFGSNWGQDHVAIFAPRRRGKTTFLQQEFTAAAEAEGYLVAYADLLEDRDAPELAVTRGLLRALEGSPRLGFLRRRSLALKLRKRLTGLAMSASVSAGVSASATGSASLNLVEVQLADLFADTFQAFAKAGEGKALLIIDEFQQIGSAGEAGLAFAGRLRAHLQMAKGSVRSIFTGSYQHAMELMLNHRNAPFYQFAARVEFPNLGRDFVHHMAEWARRQSGGQVELDEEELMHTFVRRGSNPAHLHQLVTLCLTDSLPLTEADRLTYDRFTASLGYGDKLVDLKPLHYHALVLVLVEDPSPYGTETLLRIGKAEGRKVSSAQLQSAFKTLENRGFLAHEGRNAQRYFEDPTFSDWLFERILEEDPRYPSLLQAAKLHKADVRARERIGKPSPRSDTAVPAKD
ncbi:MAG: hypothetical protein HYV16_02085 [Gammaproteobacteria bacterium]|nr:hypothetical protein [Gammaproteobacteria bacterium]